jgi:hypothetical protein
VCGGRTYSAREFMWRRLDRIHAWRGVTHVIHGAAPGADTLAKEWAAARGIAVTGWPADWPKHGKAAGPIRNRAMLYEGKPDICAAFPGGRGTRDMLEQAYAMSHAMGSPEIFDWTRAT